MAGNQSVEVDGLRELVAELKGPRFKDVNRELRQHSRLIAADVMPLIVTAVEHSHAPQAHRVAKATRVHSDRVPVIVVGKVNPWTGKAWRRRGMTAREAKLRRGSLARGVLYGPKGGHRDTAKGENYYRIPRDETAGPLGRALRDNSPLIDRAADLYLTLYLRTLRAHGWEVKS